MKKEYMKKEYCAFKTVINDQVQEVWRRVKAHKQGEINNQDSHHRKTKFREEYIGFLIKDGIDDNYNDIFMQV